MLLTILGEYVLPRPPGVWQETLVTALATLGYKEQAARQALARSATEGWLQTERRGRRARLFLTPPTAEMLRSGAERIYAFGDPWTWDGRWLLILLRVPENRREVRHRVRTQLAWAGFGSLGGGVWISPHVAREPEIAAAQSNGSVAEILSFQAEIGRIGEPRRLVSEAWDLDRIAAQYRDFLADFGRLRPRTPEAVFAAQTAIVHAWRKFPFLDPDLPEALLPSRWPRQRAHDLFQDRHARWLEPARDYFEGLEG
jgi:phenylacetic acid degradation operon negative regulatory protein